MRKNITFSALLCLVAVSAFAQEKYYAYCDIRVFGDNRVEFLAKHAKLHFDFGKEKVADLLDDEGNVIDFDSQIEAVNYLSKHGWKLEQMYATKVLTPMPVPKEDWYLQYVDVQHCVMSKQVSNDDEITEGLRLKYYVKEKKPREAVDPIVGADGKRKIVLSKRREAYTGGAEGNK